MTRLSIIGSFKYLERVPLGNPDPVGTGLDFQNWLGASGHVQISGPPAGGCFLLVSISGIAPRSSNTNISCDKIDMTRLSVNAVLFIGLQKLTLEALFLNLELCTRVLESGMCGNPSVHIYLCALRVS